MGLPDELEEELLLELAELEADELEGEPRGLLTAH
jgi:hypothetical protein